MNTNYETINKLKNIETIDSSELSSDISEEIMNTSFGEVDKPSSIQNNTNKSNTGEFYPSKKINGKRSRFYSENNEERKTYYNGLKIRKINNRLKDMTKFELLNSNLKKFNF